MRPLFDQWTYAMQTDAQSALANVVRVDARGRRRYREQFKQELIRRCLEPGASVSRLSIEAGVNTNLLRRWILLAQRVRAAADAPGAFLPVVLAEASTAAAPVPTPASRRPLADAPIAGGIEIALASGARVRIGAAVSAEQVAAVIAALR